MTDREAYIALNGIDDLGPVSIRTLAAALGSPAALFEAPAAALERVPGVGAERVRALLARREAVDPAAAERRAARLGARIVTLADPDYPEPLRAIHDPPSALYVRGTLAPEDRRAVAIVGSRRSTWYGRSMADRLAFELARAGFTVVSGLARGIDQAAHEGALKGGGRTLAVLGGALDRLYPPDAGPLAERIAGAGAVLTEYPPGRAPDRATFPYRNRIVSGMSMGVLLIEGDTRSGAMITAERAAEQGRTVFAVPGRVDSPASRGPHRLLRDGARLVEDVTDILDEFSFLLPREAPARPAAAPAPAAYPFSFSDEERRVVDAVAEGHEDIDALSRAVGLDAARLSAVLLGLELKRVVRMQPGRRVELAVALAPED